MLPKGLIIRPQLLLPVWTARNLAFVRNSASKGPNGDSPSQDGPPLSLFEELFPDKSKKLHNLTSSPPNVGDSRGVQKDRIPQSSEWTTPKEHQPRSKIGRHLPTEQATEWRSIPLENSAGILVLSNASKSLTLSDFLRLSPKGEHIDGWASGIINVIPGRDPQTLEPHGHYVIIFSTTAAARAYKDKFIRHHRISHTYTPTSLASPLAPPPGYLKDGEDLHAVMRAFTLVPSSQHHLSIRMLRKPFSPAIQRLITDGNYPAIVARQQKSDDLVLLSLDKGNLGIYELRSAIGRDGNARNLRWNLLPEQDDIVKLEGGKAFADDLGLASPDVRQESEWQQRRRGKPPRFILSFTDNQEARRFVRVWHRRPFPLRPGLQYPEDDEPPIVNAELLW